MSIDVGNDGTGFKRLNERVIRPGDIILTTTTAAVSKAIRLTTRSDISHAMVYVEDRSVIDATGEGVHARNTQRLFFEEDCAVYVLRLRGGTSDQQLTAVRTYLRGHIGTQYSAREAMQVSLGGARQWSKKQFCSRLVTQAFASAGIKLVTDPNFCSPADIKACPLVVSIADATVPVTAEEAVSWENIEDMPQRMRDVTNALFSHVRTKDPGIQTFDDIRRHLVHHPEDDDVFCKMLKASGYLTVWKIDCRLNPWHYDLALMNAEPADQIREYCCSTLRNKDGGSNRYIINRGVYLSFARQYGLRFFQMILDLYEHLATLHCKRIETATRWLEDNGYLHRTAPVPLMPHTAKWFAALEQWDPTQAMMTREIIKLCGRSDVCSVCGDDPAKDYRLTEGDRPPSGVDTLRLCDGCVIIRAASGESFEPLSPNDPVGD